MGPEFEKNQEGCAEWITLRVRSTSEIIYLQDGSILVRAQKARALTAPPGAAVRRALNKALPTGSVFDAFVLDYFPAIKRMFASGMDRTERTNILLESMDATVIVQRLEEYVSEEMHVMGASFI